MPNTRCRVGVIGIPCGGRRLTVMRLSVDLHMTVSLMLVTVSLMVMTLNLML
jgi:hypothetical protein